MNTAHRITLVLALAFGGSAFATPALTEKNINLAAPGLRVWNIKTTSAQREGSTTSNENGKLTLNFKDGSKATGDAKFKVKSATIFQDGEICHNYGKQCYCATTTFRLESGMSKWKFAVPSNGKPVQCPSGIQPTGDADIKKSMTKEEMMAKRNQFKAERDAERLAKSHR